MSIKILMPALSPTMTEGILQKWLVKVGDEVKAGDTLAEIETDKATMEVEAVDEGTITKILVEEGTEGVLVNSTIAILNGLENDEEDKLLTNNVTNESEIKTKEVNISKKNFDENNNLSSSKKQIIKKNKNIIASPFAKKFAKDKNIDLNSISGSGPKGRIIKQDFKYLNSQDKIFKSKSIHDSVEASSMRKAIAERTTLTKNSVPHFYLSIESEVDKLLLLRKKINERNSYNKISINDFLVKALALAQSKNPQTNVSWSNGKIIKYSSSAKRISQIINKTTTSTSILKHVFVVVVQ